MPLFKKHAGLFSLLAVLLSAAAAPYLIPENPDSAVFRSGTLGAILLLAGFFPVREALRRANRRTLTAGAAFGLLFALALSLGSELRVYGGLLPGLGSLVRRLAVPLLAAPLLGGLCARIMLIRRPFLQARKIKLPLAAYAAVLLLCWLPVLLAYWPGMLNYDFNTEFLQQIDHSYSSLHPLLHSAIMNGLIMLGERLGNPTWGLMLMSLLQMILFANALAYSCIFVQKHSAPSWLLLAMVAFYGLHPVFSVMAISMTKDTLFAAAFLLLSLKTWSALESPNDFFSHRINAFLYAVAFVSTALLRNNGVFALIFLLPIFILGVPLYRRRALKLAAFSLCICFALFSGLQLLLKPSPLDSYHLYALPSQQLVRVYEKAPLTEEQRTEIASWYTDDTPPVYTPYLADRAKNDLKLKKFEANQGGFRTLWFKYAKLYPGEYVNALLQLNLGSWYPDDLSHSTVYRYGFEIDLGYLQTQEYPMDNHGLHVTCYLPRVHAFYEQLCRNNSYQSIPFLSILFCTATPFWMLVLGCAFLVERKHPRMILVFTGAFGLWFSYLLGPCTIPRYALPLFCLAPPFLFSSVLFKEDV